jgi:hypothetical protein
MEPKGSLPHSQVPATCLYPEPAQSSPYPHIPFPEDPLCTKSHVPFSLVRSYQRIGAGQRLCLWIFRNTDTFSRWGVFRPSLNPQAGGPPFAGCPRLLIQYIPSYPPYWNPFLHPQTEDAPCRGDRDLLITWVIIIIIVIIILLQLSCHSVALVLTIVHTKQIRINIRKRNNAKTQYNHTKTQYKQYKNTVQTIQHSTNNNKHNNTLQAFRDIAVTVSLNMRAVSLNSANS